jgi:chromosome partitioning protein
VKIASVINHKGGVGKTTLAGSVAQALALCGYRVLAVDNDGQHNLTAMLGGAAQQSSLRDVYRAGPDRAAGVLTDSIRPTPIAGLHVLPADSRLTSADVPDLYFLQRCFERSRLYSRYDHVLIDNAPGMEALQLCAIHASHALFVPTELKQFAVDGIVEMEQTLRRNYPTAPPITEVVPNFYRNTIRQNSFLLALRQLFPGRVTATAVPQDAVYDELVTDRKVLFLHRLYSRGAAHFLKLVQELYDLDQDDLWQRMLESRKERLADEARERSRQRRRGRDGARR